MLRLSGAGRQAGRQATLTSDSATAVRLQAGSGPDRLRNPAESGAATVGWSAEGREGIAGTGPALPTLGPGTGLYYRLRAGSSPEMLRL